MPNGVMGSGRTLAVHMYNLASEGLYMDQAYATAVILLLLVVRDQHSVRRCTED